MESLAMEFSDSVPTSDFTSATVEANLKLLERGTTAIAEHTQCAWGKAAP